MTFNYVQSITGMVKEICRSDCTVATCLKAHPNTAGSMVAHPKWCLRGCMTTCELHNCPFNHFRYEVDFVAYRANDDYWYRTHRDLCAVYQSRVDKQRRRNGRSVRIEPMISDCIKW